MSEKRMQIKGDWLINGHIDNLDRRRFLDVLVRANGKVVLAGEDEPWLIARGEFPAITLDEDGAIRQWGADVSFLPDDSEIARLANAGVTLPNTVP